MRAAAKKEITDLVNTLKAFTHLVKLEKKTYAIIQSAISELQTLEEQTNQQFVSKDHAYDKATLIFLYALKHIPMPPSHNET